MDEDAMHNNSFVKRYFQQDGLLDLDDEKDNINCAHSAKSKFDVLVLLPGQGTTSMGKLSPEKTIEEVLIELELITGFVAEVSSLHSACMSKPSTDTDTEKMRNVGYMPECLPKNMRLGEVPVSVVTSDLRLVLLLQLRPDAEELLGAVLTEDKHHLQMAGSVARNPRFRQSPDVLFAALFLACNRGLRDICSRLIALLGMDISSRTKCGGRTLLHAAAVHNHVHLVQILLWRKCPLNIKDCNGCTALDLAEQHDAPDALRLLQQHQTLSASPLSRNSCPTTPRPRSAAQGSVSPTIFSFPLPGRSALRSRQKSAQNQIRASETPPHLATSGEHNPLGPLAPHMAMRRSLRMMSAGQFGDRSRGSSPRQFILTPCSPLLTPQFHTERYSLRKFTIL